jgi:hypothetical protein
MTIRTRYRISSLPCDVTEEDLEQDSIRFPAPALPQAADIEAPIILEAATVGWLLPVTRRLDTGL